MIESKFSSKAVLQNQSDLKQPRYDKLGQPFSIDDKLLTSFK